MMMNTHDHLLLDEQEQLKSSPNERTCISCNITKLIKDFPKL